MRTVGSRGVRTSVKLMQQAGASARERLRVAAAQGWNVDAADCTVASGKCLHSASNRSVEYGALAAAAAAVQLPQEPGIRAPRDYRLVGKWTPRLDTAVKLDGSAKFGIDAQVPGMVYAAVWSTPVAGGSLKAVDESGLKALPGLLGVVKLKDSVVVVADKYWRAKKGLDALKIQWDAAGQGGVQQADLDKGLRDALDGPMFTAEKKGEPEAAFAAPGAKLVEATYEAPFLSHSPMEPLNCTVQLAPDRVDVWISTQAPMAVLETAAKETGVAPENAANRNEQLPASLTTQIDGGVRFSHGASRLVLGAFQISKPYYSFDAANRYVELGDVAHRGVEVSFAGQVAERLNLLAGAVLMDPVVTGEARDLARVGKRPVGTTAAFARIDADYRTAIEGLSFSAAMVYNAQRTASTRAFAELGGRQLTVPATATFDLGARYRFKVGDATMSARLQVTNLFDKASWKVLASNSYQLNDSRKLQVYVVADF